VNDVDLLRTSAQEILSETKWATKIENLIKQSHFQALWWMYLYSLVYPLPIVTYRAHFRTSFSINRETQRYRSKCLLEEENAGANHFQFKPKFIH